MSSRSASEEKKKKLTSSRHGDHRCETQRPPWRGLEVVRRHEEGVGRREARGQQRVLGEGADAVVDRRDRLAEAADQAHQAAAAAAAAARRPGAAVAAAAAQQQQQQQRVDPAPPPQQQQLVPEESAREPRALNSRKRRSAARLQAYNLRKRREAAAAPSPARKRDRSGSPERSPAAPAPPPLRLKFAEFGYLAALPAPLATHNPSALFDAPLATHNSFAILGAPPSAPDPSDPFDDYPLI